jgi:hypothetical protein
MEPVAPLAALAAPAAVQAAARRMQVRSLFARWITKELFRRVRQESRQYTNQFGRSAGRIIDPGSNPQSRIPVVSSIRRTKRDSEATVPRSNWVGELRERSVPGQFQGIGKERVRATLRLIDRDTDDMTDAVFALLDDVTPSPYTVASSGARFCNGASTAHIAVHVGLFQRQSSKLDREGRDYWIKPLREVGAVEPVYLDPKTGGFVAGHPVAKSPNSAYRLTKSFLDVLKAPEETWHEMVSVWASGEQTRVRLTLQAEAAAAARLTVGTKRSDLIRACNDIYAPRFLRGYEVLFIDDGDGDRITSEQRARLAEAGVELGPADSMPDLLLWNREQDSLWVIEAVTSDGEVDLYKRENLTSLAGRARKNGIGFTTAYPSWTIAKARQAAHKNIAPSTYLWVMEDPSKHFLALDEQQNLLVVGARGSS